MFLADVVFGACNFIKHNFGSSNLYHLHLIQVNTKRLGAYIHVGSLTLH